MTTVADSPFLPLVIARLAAVFRVFDPPADKRVTGLRRDLHRLEIPPVVSHLRNFSRHRFSRQSGLGAGINQAIDLGLNACVGLTGRCPKHRLANDRAHLSRRSHADYPFAPMLHEVAVFADHGCVPSRSVESPYRWTKR